MPPLLLAAAGRVVETLSYAGADEAEPDMKEIAGVALTKGLPPPSLPTLGLPFDGDGEADDDELAVPLSCAAFLRLS
jgi:hypothetical protein